MQSEMFEELREKLKKIMEKNPNIIGWSNKIREGKVRIYLSEKPIQSSLIQSIKVGEQEYPIEYVVLGKIRALGG